MIIVTNATKAKAIFAKYSKNIGAFSAGKIKAIDDSELQLGLTHLNILPDDDTINAVLNGDMKAKKVIKSAQKALRIPDMEHKNLCIEMAQLVNMVSSDRKLTKSETKNIKKHGPNIIVIVLDDDNGDKVIAAKNKFLTKYLKEVFSVFGIQIVTEGKVLKKLFGGKGKKGKTKKVVSRVAEFIRANDSVRISGKGMKTKKRLFNFYAVELRQAAISALIARDDFDIRKDEYAAMIKTLVDTYTNNNMNYVCGDLDSKKDQKKMAKAMRAKNKIAVEAYESFTEILNAAMGADMDLPKVKFGYDKKGKAPKMKIKKFVKFFDKKKNHDFLIMLYAHTTAVLCEVPVGSKEYNKIMTNTIGQLSYEDSFSKAFIAAAKTQKPEETK